ncbi:hypothetical protein DQ384_06225 [Sphaerisporangium album]|uniref:Uncharacterized protein n=1 Tax=Sphaerisporangium album TaxID=509200 RepID=A0A367FQC2_9ACTN|nr:hypothetical protein DQ384_06225 [Sphaerisporangium album]
MALSLALGRGWHRCAYSSVSVASSPGISPVTRGMGAVSCAVTVTRARPRASSSASRPGRTLNASSDVPPRSSTRPTWPSPETWSVTSPSAPSRSASASARASGIAGSSCTTSAPRGDAPPEPARTTGTSTPSGPVAAECAASVNGSSGYAATVNGAFREGAGGSPRE